MKFLVPSLLLLGIALGCSHHEAAPDFRALYSEYETAVRARDHAGYQRFFAADFTMVSSDGKVHNSAEMAEYQKVNAATTKKVNAYSITIACVARAGDGYEVITVQKYDRDQAPLDKPNDPHNIRTSVVHRETWRPDSGVWKIRKIEELLQGTVYFDGKVMTE